MMKKLSLIVLISILLAVFGCTDNSSRTETELENKFADLVLKNGFIATVDPNIGNVTAIAINDYLITATGDDQKIDEFIGPNTEVIDLDGRFVMPGFIEGHGHFMSLGRSKQILDLNDVDGWEEIVSKVAVEVDKSKPGEWIFGRGWHQDKWSSCSICLDANLFQKSILLVWTYQPLQQLLIQFLPIRQHHSSLEFVLIYLNS